MLEGCDGRLEVVAVRVGGARVLVVAYWLSDAGLREGCGERNLWKLATASCRVFVIRFRAQILNAWA